METTRRTLIGGAAALGLAPVSRLRAQGRIKLTVGVLTDLSGTYREGGCVARRRGRPAGVPETSGFE